MAKPFHTLQALTVTPEYGLMPYRLQVQGLVLSQRNMASSFCVSYSSMGSLKPGLSYFLCVDLEY